MKSLVVPQEGAEEIGLAVSTFDLDAVGDAVFLLADGFDFFKGYYLFGFEA
jgi:hypothetical protein